VRGGGEAARWVVASLAIAANLVVFVLLKWVGLGALAVASLVLQLFLDFPMTLHVSAWYAGYGYAALAIVGSIALCCTVSRLAWRAVARCRSKPERLTKAQSSKRKVARVLSTYFPL
jgi:hypothetical protein